MTKRKLIDNLITSLQEVNMDEAYTGISRIDSIKKRRDLIDLALDTYAMEFLKECLPKKIDNKLGRKPQYEEEEQLSKLEAGVWNYCIDQTLNKANNKLNNYSKCYYCEKDENVKSMKKAGAKCCENCKRELIDKQYKIPNNANNKINK